MYRYFVAHLYAAAPVRKHSSVQCSALTPSLRSCWQTHTRIYSPACRIYRAVHLGARRCQKGCSLPGTGVRGYAPPRSFCFRVCLYAPTFPLLLQYAGTDSVIRICDPHSSVLSMLFQLLSGTDKELANKKLRGEINVLLCGDPGTR